MTAPFTTLRSASVAPFVLSCEHAKATLPERIRPTAAERAVLRTHWGWDIGGWALTRELSGRLATSAVGSRWSRLWIDLNRRADDASLVRKVAGGVPLSWNADAGPEEIERRLIHYHSPYHVEVDRLIQHRLVRGIRPLLFAVHTFTPVYDGRRRPFEIGVLYEEHRGLAHRLGRTMRDAGLSVRYNQPYSGMAGMMYSVDRHGKHHGLPCLELEVNHDMFDRASNVQRLGKVVEAGLRDLAAHAGRGDRRRRG